MAIYAIGDLQGCYDPFRELLDAIDFDPDKDKLWLVGDLVNRGPKSLKTLRFVKSLGESAITVLGNHDLHLLALATGRKQASNRFRTLQKTLNASDREELIDWLRHRPLAHYDKSINTMMVHAGTHPQWSVKKTLARAAEVEQALQGGSHKKFLGAMYGNSPRSWSGKLKGNDRLRFIVNCLTRMRMITTKGRLNFAHSGSPFRARRNLVPWFDIEGAEWRGTRIVFGHWSALGLVVLPDYISLDTGCVWGRQLTAVRLDRKVVRVYQVPGQA
ncbi:MAG: symmetrical bis(5'-nucleosyl)-tetraphosphatase [Woeseiaceae bacterium]|jgi:bis(5'-nucleosyl)-tetraphosphatase (symmetrical)